MKELDTDDVATLRKAGGIDLPTIQKYLNFWFTASLDLFGCEVSSNAANYFAPASRAVRTRPSTPTTSKLDTAMTIEVPDGKGGMTKETSRCATRMNEVLRREYIKDCHVGVDALEQDDQARRRRLRAHAAVDRFRRQIGIWAGMPTAPDGQPISAGRVRRAQGEWLPTDGRRGLRQEPDAAGGRARQDGGWIAPPDRGINGLPVDYEYVKL